jgi:hypothetical protein
MYAAVCSADVRRGTTGHTLCKLNRQTYTGPPNVRGTTERTLYCEYPLDNTWMYEAAIEPLGKNHRTYTPWPDVRYFSRPINSTLASSFSHHFHTLLGCQSISRVFFKRCECFVSVCVRRLQARNVREAKLLRFCFKEVTFNP